MGEEKKVGVLTDLVSKLGFPIVVTVWLFYERWTILTQQSQTLDKLTQTINQNTLVVQELMGKIAQIGGH